MPIKRSLICSTLGHVDHGKTLLLDRIRGSAVQRGEAGGITQAIGASIIPIETIRKVCGPLLLSLKREITIPGLLFIDTPGHAAFTSLRKRGGNLADIAIVVVDINEGLMPQTEEAIEILRQAKTPFLIAANKIDLIRGWTPSSSILLETLTKQPREVIEAFDRKLYEFVGQFYEKFQMNADRFDRVQDYTKQVAIVPTSAMTGDGIPELLMVLTGLAQRYLEGCLECEPDGPGRGSILELREEKGLGMTADVILYDGTLQVNDVLVVGTLDQPFVTKVKALLLPSPLMDMRDRKSKFHGVKQVWAATGVKVSAPDLDKTVSGMPVHVASHDDTESVMKAVRAEVEEVLIQTDENGVIAKADTLGSLEALSVLLRHHGIPIMKAMIGPIGKKDVLDAEANAQKDPLNAAVLGFNVPAEGVESSKAVIFAHNVIYRLIEDFQGWQAQKRSALVQAELGGLVRPAKIEVLRGYVFRQSNPAVFGISVSAGCLEAHVPMMNANGDVVGTVKAIQAEQENVEKAELNQQVAVSMDGVIMGRQIQEGDTLYVDVPEDDFKKLRDHKEYLSKGEVELLREIAKIKRKGNVVWGV